MLHRLLRFITLIECAKVSHHIRIGLIYLARRLKTRPVPALDQIKARGLSTSCLTNVKSGTFKSRSILIR